MSKLSIHISKNPTGLDDLLRKCAEADSPVSVIYSVNQNIADSIARISPATRWIYRRQSGPFDRLPDWEGDPAQNAKKWLTQVEDKDDQGRTLVENWALNPATWYDPLNEPVIALEQADANDPVKVADAVRKAQWLNTWMMTALDIADNLGFKLALFSFPTGIPPLLTWNEINTSQIQAPPNPECQAVVWHYLLPALRRGKQSGAILSLHQYSVEGSMQHPKPGNVLRHRDVWDILPADARIPVVITECSSGNGYGKGAGLSGQPWVDDMAAYDAELMKDSFVLAGCAFQLGEGAESHIPLPVLEKYGDYISTHPTPSEPLITSQPQASSEGTTVPPNPAITDSAGHAWSLGDSEGVGRRLLRDGLQFAGGQGVLLLYHNHKVFTRNSRNEWFVATTEWQPIPGDPRPLPAISDQVESGDVAQPRSVGTTPVVTTSGQPVVFGIHGCADVGDLSPQDLSIMRFVANRVTGYKFLTGHSRSHYDTIINDVKIPAANCLTRLFMDMEGRANPPKAAEFVNDMTAAIQDAWAFGIRWFELHNEPNLFKEWKESWGGATAFVAWAKEVIGMLRSRPEWDGIKIVSPGLSPHDDDAIGQHTDRWIDVFASEGLFAACDAVGAHAYWGNRQSMLTRKDGLNFQRYFERTDKPIWLTEFSNNQPVDPSVENPDVEKGKQYRDYLKHLRQNEPRIERAYCFVLSGRNFDNSKETWVRADLMANIPTGVMA